MNKQLNTRQLNKEDNMIFAVTFFQDDITKIKRAYKILTRKPTSSKMKTKDVNFEMMFRKSTKEIVDKIFENDSETISDLRQACKREMRRFRINSEHNALRAQQDKDFIVSEDVKISFYKSLVDRFFAGMKRINGDIQLNIFLHTILVYYSDIVIEKHQAKQEKLRKQRTEVMKELKQAEEEHNEFKTFAEAYQEAKKEAANKSEEPVPTAEELMEELDQENNNVIQLSKRDKKKVKKEINNIAIEEILESDEYVVALKTEEERLQENIKTLRKEEETLILQVKKIKDMLKGFTNDLLDLSTMTEEVGSSINNNDYNVLMTKKIMSAKKMRNMDYSKEQKFIENIAK